MTSSPPPAQDASCLVCGSANLLPFFDLKDVPVHVNRLFRNREAALQAPMAHLSLVFCPRCSHIFNQAFDPARLVYDEGYENSLHFSERFNQYARAAAEHLVQQYGLRQKNIVEIGSGKGEFLVMLCELGENNGIGFDPSYEPGLVDEENGRVHFVQDYYSPQYAHLPVDLLCSRHVLEHIAAPRALIEQMRQTLGDQPDRVAFFEVPNGLYTLRDLGIWDIIYEHVSYFTPTSLEWLFRSCGFKIEQVSEAFGGQFLTLEARPETNPPEAQVRAASSPPQETTAFAAAFAEKDRQKVDEWSRRLADLRAAGKKTVLWGAGSKGVTFLNRLHQCRPAERAVEWVVDVNPRKMGKFIPGVGLEIVAPSALCEIKPDVILVMNPIYLEEIQRRLASDGLAPQTIAV